jgi:hypothetical protein
MPGKKNTTTTTTTTNNYKNKNSLLWILSRIFQCNLITNKAQNHKKIFYLRLRGSSNTETNQAAKNEQPHIARGKSAENSEVERH